MTSLTAAQADTGGGPVSAWSSSKRRVGSREVAKKEATTSSAAPRKAIFSAASWASS